MCSALDQNYKKIRNSNRELLLEVYLPNWFFILAIIGVLCVFIGLLWSTNLKLPEKVFLYSTYLTPLIFSVFWYFLMRGVWYVKLGALFFIYPCFMVLFGAPVFVMCLFFYCMI